MENEEIKSGAEKVYEDDQWLVIAPHNKEASCYYGKDTRWCTASNLHHNTFDRYIKGGKLYINIDKVNNRKYQFHFETGSFMDEKDQRIKKNVYDTIGLSKSLLNYYKEKYPNEWFEMKYDYVDSFFKGLARVKLNGKYGFINKEGNEVIPFKYDYAWNFSEGLAQVKLNDKWGYIDKEGNEIVPIKYDWVDIFNEGLAAVKLNGKWGYADKHGNEVIPLKYDFIGGFNNDLSKIKLNDKWGYIDKENNWYDSKEKISK